GGGENPSSWSHPDIVGAFDPLDPTDANNHAQLYYQVSELWDTGLRTFARGIQTSMDQAWSGAAAEASKASIKNYVTKAEELTPVLNELSTRVTEAASASAQTNSALPDPVVITWTSWLWPPNRWDLQREQSEEEQAARDAMRDYYVQPFKSIDSSIPVLPTPVSPTSSPDITPPPGGKWVIDDGTGGGGPGGGGGGNDGGSGAGEPDSGEPGAGEQPEEGQPEGSENSSEDQSDTSGTPSSRDPANTTPAGTTPAGANPSDPGKTVPSGSTPSSPGSGSPGSPGSGSPGSPGSGSPGSPGSGSPGSPGSGSPGSPGSSTPQPGRSVPGAGVVSPASPAGSSSTSAASGGAGRAGMAGMGAPGARGGGKDEESSRATPDYLITQENTDELLGEAPR